MAIHTHRGNHHTGNVIIDLWDSFWNSPDITCPKCGCKDTEYYDPFFFAPIRTFKGKRRLKCTSCGFIWRPLRKSESVWDRCKKII